MTDVRSSQKSLLRDASFIPKATQACDEIHELTRQIARLAISSPSLGPEDYVNDNIDVGHVLRGIQQAWNMIGTQLPPESEVGYRVMLLADELLVLRVALAHGVANTVPETSEFQSLANQMYFGDPFNSDQIDTLVDALRSLREKR